MWTVAVNQPFRPMLIYYYNLWNELKAASTEYAVGICSVFR